MPQFQVNKEQPIKDFIDMRLYTHIKGKWYEVRQRPTIEEGIPKPDRSIFKSGNVNTLEHLIHGSPQPMPFITEIEYPTKEKPAKNGDEGGIYVHYQDFKHPRKGFPFPEVVQANNVVKRLITGQIRLLVKNPIAALSLVKKSNLERWLNELIQACEVSLKPYYLADDRYNKTCREVRVFVKTFFEEIGIQISSELGYLFANLLEWDDAYSLILQDIMSETTKEALLKNPAKEFNRLLDILKEREDRQKIQEMAGGQIKL